MARKKKSDAAVGVSSIVSSFLQNVVGGLLSNVFDTAKSRADDMVSHVSRLILYIMLLLISAIFVVIGAVMIVYEYYYFNPGWVFLGGAVIFIFWALITKIQIEKAR